MLWFVDSKTFEAFSNCSQGFKILASIVFHDEKYFSVSLRWEFCENSWKNDIRQKSQKRTTTYSTLKIYNFPDLRDITSAQRLVRMQECFWRIWQRFWAEKWRRNQWRNSGCSLRRNPVHQRRRLAPVPPRRAVRTSQYAPWNPSENDRNREEL